MAPAPATPKRKLKATELTPVKCVSTDELALIGSASLQAMGPLEFQHERRAVDAELQICEATAISELESALEHIKLFVEHCSLDKHTKHQLRQDLKLNPEDHLLAWSDWEDWQ